MGFHKWKIEIPIYNYTLVIYTGKDVISVIKRYKLETYMDMQTIDEASLGLIDGLAFSTENDLAIIIPLDAPISIVAHEATHIINFIFEDIGYITRPDNDESFTYFLTWLIDEIELRMQPKRSEIKKKGKKKPSKQRVVRNY